MRIAIDVHGTIDKNPKLFKLMMEIYLSAGIEVYIVSGPPVEEIHKELEKLKFKLDKHFSWIYSVVDYLRSHTTVEMTQDDKGHWWCAEKDWWDSKGMMCKHYNIDVIIDNEIKYKDNMPEKTKFIHWIKEIE